MVILAWVLGILGGLGVVAGIITATEVVPLLTQLPTAFTPIFWLTLGAVLLLACIATILAQRQYE